MPLAVGLVAIVTATSCWPQQPPTATPTPPHLALTIVAGTTDNVSGPADGAAVVLEAVVATGSQSGLTVAAIGSVGGSPPVAKISVKIAASPDATSGPRHLGVDAQGCTAPLENDACPADRQWSGSFVVDVDVVSPTATPPATLASPNSGWVEKGDGSFANPTILEVATEGSNPATESDAISATAADIGAVVVGADSDLGIYWVRPPDIAGATSAFITTAGVTGAGELQAGGVQVEGVPSELGTLSEQQRWTLTQTGVDSAWASLPRPAAVELGLIDQGIYSPHPDLAPNLASYDPAGGDAYAAWISERHGTHVAGTMCASGNNGGVAGVDYTCRLRAFDFGEAVVYDAALQKNVSTEPTANVLQSIVAWLNKYGATASRPNGMRVVNMSFTLEGAYWKNGCKALYHDFWRRKFKQELFDAFPRVLFVVAAGNCGKAAAAPEVRESYRESIRDKIPADLANDPEYPTSNVIAVSATVRATSGAATRTLANYSAPDGEVAAPGGYAQESTGTGVYSTWRDLCVPFVRWCSASYAYDGGTSMAAPFIAGLAGLMISTNPSMTPPEIEACLKASAVTPVIDIDGAAPRDGLPGEVWAPEALRCASPQPEGGSATQVSAGLEQSCALMQGGTAKCWGGNSTGLLGYESVFYQIEPARDVVGLTGATQIEAGWHMTCALLAGGTPECWGMSQTLGNGTVIGITGARQMATGEGHACALMPGGTAKCWGGNSAGERGNGTTMNPTSFTDATDVLGVAGATQIVVGGSHSCALMPDGRAKCWGMNSDGQLGIPASYGVATTPVDVVGLAGATQLAAGARHTCGLMLAGTVKCWGTNDNRQLGLDSAFQSSSPVDVAGISGATQITSGGYHTCALVSGGTVKCWGENRHGELGNGTVWSTPSPIDVIGLSGVTQVEAGVLHTCAVLSAGNVKCWGDNTWGELGDFSTIDEFTGGFRTTPVDVRGV